ncbi:MAG: TolC family protein [Armatimonadetes bacterium]|nr:TolC family protein [Armatimonadota bacterium]
MSCNFTIALVFMNATLANPDDSTKFSAVRNSIPFVKQAVSELTLDEAVRLALANNPRVKALVFDISAAELGLAAAQALANPNVTLNPGFTRAGSDEELMISQPLEINGSRSARAGMASAQLRVAESEALIELREIVYETKSAYLQLARAQERNTLANDVVGNSEELDRIAQRQVELGSRPGIDRTQTSIELTRARQQATLSGAEFAAARAELNTIIGRPVGEIAVLPLLQFSPQTIDESLILQQAMGARAEIAASAATREGFLQEARLARAEGIPDIAPHFRATSLTRSPHENGFGIGITIPLLDYGSRRNRIRQAEESAKAHEQRAAAVRNRVLREVSQAVARLRAANAVLRMFQGGMLDEARKVLEATRNGFRIGGVSLLAVLEAQRTYRTVQAEYIDALASHEQARAQLERATGAVPTSVLKDLRSMESKKQ